MRFEVVPLKTPLSRQKPTFLFWPSPLRFQPIPRAVVVLRSLSTIIPLVLLIALFLPVTFAFAAMMTDERSERLARWKDRWDSNKISWHKEEIHEVLKKHGEQVLPGLFSTDAVCAAPPKTVFVPLCGKTVDMAHLAASPAVEKVVGVDGILQALEAFAFEQPQLEIHPAAAEEGGGGGGDDGYRRLKGRKIELLQGDFFELDEELSTGGRRFAVIFDRASLIAIDPSLRERYVEITGKLLQPGGQILLVTLTRPDENGPPFSTPESAVRDLYEKQPWVESVTTLEHPAGEEVRDGGVWTNLAFLIQGKS